MKNDQISRFQTDWEDRKLSIEHGKLAMQATSSLTVSYGDTVVLATVTRSKKEREGIDFFPLMVDYEEKLYAAGKIKGSRFIKREGRPTDEAILTGRMIDRSIRPFFNDKDRNEIQVILSVLSFDKENDPDIVGLIAASAVLTISPIDWAGPIAGARIGRIDGKLAVNPSYTDREKGDLDLIVAGTPKKVIMIEAGAKEVGEKDMAEAIFLGQKSLAPVIKLIEEVNAKVGANKKVVIAEKEEDQKLVAFVEKFSKKNLEKYLFDSSLETKKERKKQVENFKSVLCDELIANDFDESLIVRGKILAEKKVEAAVTEYILKEEKRVDGRKLDEIRELSAEVSVLPRTHGSGLFARGQTQVLSAVTLGSPGDEQHLDGMEEEGKKSYMHHYNFPPFSVGETGFMRGPGRRDIGHGALAEKALIPVLPEKDSFPYTIRVVSETLSSNGSSSMGSVCGSTLALMDAGVPIKRPVAGIAMGIASSEGLNEWKILTDIQDLEDGKGGMDFKVAGTSAGITAIQLDTKTLGITPELVSQTLERAKTARLEILEVMTDAIAEPRAEMSPYAPRITTIRINPEKIRNVIGTGGKIINEIIDETGVSIDIEDDGLVIVCSANEESSKKAIEWIKNLTHEVKPGEIFQGRIARLMDFGVIAEILPGQDGLVHISEMANYRVGRVEDVVKVGDMVPVKVLAVDPTGKISLSMRAALPGAEDRPRKERSRRDDRSRGSRPPRL